MRVRAHVLVCAFVPVPVCAFAHLPVSAWQVRGNLSVFPAHVYFFSFFFVGGGRREHKWR